MRREPRDPGPFALDRMKPRSRRLPRLVLSPLERALGLSRMNQEYRRLSRDSDAPALCNRVLLEHAVDYELDPADLRQVPLTGPTLLVANHPFGFLDGIILTSVLGRLKRPFRILANASLKQVPELRELVLAVDPFQRPESRQNSFAGLRAALLWLKRESGLLAMFPAGEVAHFFLRQRRILEPAWIDTVARLVLKTEATVVPLHFEGTNSRWFHAAGLVHPGLRTALLPREFLRHRNRRISVRIGTAISSTQLRGFGSDEEMTRYLRMRTLNLSSHIDLPASRAPSIHPSPEPIAAAMSGDLLAREIAGLPAEQTLVTVGDTAVLIASADQIPNTLREIGRLREITFRGAGEGTGRSLDLDRFDDHYDHLFLWNHSSSEVVGAYRIGRSDQILEAHGESGLYTTTLFTFRKEFWSRIEPAFELGRSFVRPEAQRSYQPLMLLWKGLGRMVAREPRYARLFGSVSLSDGFSERSKQLLVQFLSVHRWHPELGSLVRPRHPLRFHKKLRLAGDDELRSITVSELDAMVQDVEHGALRVPPLIKHYLKTGSHVLGFQVDPMFGHCIDVLIFTDLRNTDPRVLRQYMGREGMQAFLAAHAPVELSVA